MAKQTWMWLAAGLGYGAVNIGELLSAFPEGAEAIAANLGSPRLDELLTQKQAERLASSRPADFALRISHAESMGIQVLAYNEAAYPDCLRRSTNPPPVLFVKGDVHLLNGQLSIGMVGARRPSAYGVEAVRAIGRGVALGGAIIVSGLAAGLDAEAHKAALAVNGPTIACIAFGHDHCYPAANRPLMEIIARYGAVVSEYPPETAPEKPYFLQRNRIIAALSHGLVVVEARKQSGTMSTVNFATEYGRDVFAVPGSIFSELSGGTNAMIGEGAYLAGSASDVLSVYGIALKGEDPVAVAAAKQAVEGRPAAAEAAAPWQQNLRRYVERTSDERTPQQEEVPGQQTLGELLEMAKARAAANVAAGSSAPTGRTAPMSTARAVEAMRTLQQAAPPETDSELDARNRMLDEMVAAVTDSVEIGSKPERPAQPARRSRGNTRSARDEGGDPRVRPYNWDDAERLSSADLEKQHRQQTQRQARARSVAATNSVPASPPVYSGPVGPVEAVGRVEPVGATPGVQQVMLQEEMYQRQAAAGHRVAAAAQPAPKPAAQPGQPNPALAAQLYEQAQQQPPPVPQGRADVFAPRQETPAKALAQAEKEIHRVMQEQARPDATKPRIAQAMPPLADETAEAAEWDEMNTTGLPRNAQPEEVAVPVQPPMAESGAMHARERQLVDPEELLSDIAKRALQQLGHRPASLDDICARSGLSPAEAMAALTELELAGLSVQRAGRQFVRGDL